MKVRSFHFKDDPRLFVSFHETHKGRRGAIGAIMFLEKEEDDESGEG